VFEYANEMPGRFAGIGPETGVERWLTAACLIRRINQGGTQTQQKRHHGPPHFRVHAIDQTGYEQG
jgi:hypothetical protein